MSRPVDGPFGVDTGRRLFRIFLGADPDLENWSYDVTDLLVVPNDQPGLVRTGDAAAFEPYGIRGLLPGFPSGTTVHVLAYGATENLANAYRQPWDNLEIFTDLSPTSARTSFRPFLNGAPGGDPLPCPSLHLISLSSRAASGVGPDCLLSLEP